MLKPRIKLWQPKQVSGAKFAFFFHPPTEQHVKDAFYGANEWTEETEKELMEMDPFVPALIRKSGEVIGINLCIPWTPKMIVKNLRGFRQRAIESLEYAQLFGANYVGLGALIPSFLKNGKLLKGKVPGTYITTGHGGTTIMVSQITLQLIGTLGLDIKNTTITIVGAAGSMGRTLFQILAALVNNFLLVEKPNRLQLLRKEIIRPVEEEKKGLSIQTTDSNHLEKLRKSEIVIVVTNAHRDFLIPEHLEESFAVIDDSKPSGVGRETIKALRGKTLVLECLAAGPEEYNLGYDFGFVANNFCYSCAFEVLAVAERKVEDDFIVGYPTLDKIELLRKWFNYLQIQPAPFTETGGRPLSPSEISRVKRRIVKSTRN